jgi:N12 class adenine-specific DNA methylase
MSSAISKMNNIDGLDKRTVTQQIQQMERLEQKLEDLLSNTGDKDYEASTIENIGIDSIFIDEAHLFKNLGLPTSMSRIAGLGSTSGSQMAMDLFLKIQHINKIDGRVYLLLEHRYPTLWLNFIQCRGIYRLMV